MAKGYTLGGVHFATKDAIKKHVRSIRDAGHHRQIIDDPVVVELLSKYHPEWEDKSAGGSTLWMDVHKEAYFKSTMQIMLRRDDGSPSMDISFIHALKHLGGSVDPAKQRLTDFRKAARILIEDQVRPLRKAGHEVDHVAPQTFEVLLRDWLVWNGLQVSDISIDSTHGSGQRWWFTDLKLGEAWCEFHSQHAVLEVVTKEEHKTRRPVRVDWSALM
jgi:hypothetical protein